MANNLLNIYIKTLIDNINIENIPKEIDIIFDGGAFNGGMGFGIALYLKALEINQTINVRRVSGCSIGSIIALSYLIDLKYDINEVFISTCKNFKKTFNLSVFKNHIKKIIYDNLTDDLSSINKKLYITYYDAINYKHNVVCEYENREHLLECLMRSCHIPYITSNVFKYDNKYIDGIAPYIFRDGEREMLFIKMITRKNYRRIFNIRNEQNVNERMLIGVNDINNFFSIGKSDMCSYFEDWSIISILLLRLRLLIVFIILWIVDILAYIKSSLPNNIFEHSIIKILYSLSSELYSDLMYKIIN
tara:strand:- start:5021 stop:5932 length:912 start_codon:yes stop_codon:yes gene_type:complete